MKKLIILVLSIFFANLFLFSNVIWAKSDGLIITQIQTKSLNDDSASEELVEIYNNSEIDLNITSWHIDYGKAVITDETPNFDKTKTLASFKHTENIPGNYVFVPSKSYIILVSNEYSNTHPTFENQGIFSSGLVDNDRYIAIYNDNDEIIDRAYWSNNDSKEAQFASEGGKSASLPDSGELISRKMINENTYQDTNNNFNDFESSPARDEYKSSPLYEIEDLCLNIDEIQIEVPDGLYSDINRQCHEKIVDVCMNLEGVQTELPSGYEQDELDNCIKDVCLNLDGLQAVPPDGFDSENSSCHYRLTHPIITELLPNPDGDDYGVEFIELYNPNDRQIELDYYRLYINNDKTKIIYFPSGLVIEANSYLVIYSNQLGLTLTNSTMSLTLESFDSSFESNVAYSNAPSGMSWALIDEIWQYTSIITPNAENISDESDGEVLAASTSSLAPCKDGYYRNTETNRCKKIPVEDELEPCAEGYYRNPETNRCKKITESSDSLEPCAEGYERNPETNRCKKVSSSIPEADYAPEEVKAGSDNSAFMWSVICLFGVALAYAVWEWKAEFKKAINYIVRLFIKKH